MKCSVLNIRLLKRLCRMAVSSFILFFALSANAQTGLYVPAKGKVKDMKKALFNPEVFYMLLDYEGNDSTYEVSHLDMLDSAFRIAFDVENPMYYTMTIESYADGESLLAKKRVDAIYGYFSRRSGGNYPVRVARNKIHCSCQGDTVETLRFEVPTAKALYDTADLPSSRRLLNQTVPLANCILVTFRHNPDECVGSSRGCYIPQSDSIVRGYYSSLLLGKGSIHSVDNTKDLCPSDVQITLDDHLDYKSIVERYHLIPHRKQLLVQAGFVVLSSNHAVASDSCKEALKDSIFIRLPVTAEQMAARVRFFAKVKGTRGIEYKQLSTRKLPGRSDIVIQAPINISQFDTIYLGKRIQENELTKYFYEVDGPTEASAFKVGERYFVAYRVGRNGQYELKKLFKALFRIVPEQEEEFISDKDKNRAVNPEEIID